MHALHHLCVCVCVCVCVCDIPGKGAANPHTWEGTASNDWTQESLCFQ